MKVNRGMTENALKCKLNGGGLTFGYYIDEDKHFQPDPVKSLIVADIFSRYAGGESLKSILDTLKNQGVKNNQGRDITYSFLINIIKNRRYLGEYRFRDTVVENAFVPLVTAEIFEKCQKRLAANKLKPAHFKTVEDTYLLTGKIFCGYCSGTMQGVSGTSRTGTKHRYYHCHAAKKYKNCEKKRTAKELVETAVIDNILRLLNDKSLLNQIVDTCFDMQTNKGTHLPTLEAQLLKKQREIDNVMNAIIQGIITPTTKSTLERLEEDKENLEIEVAKERIERPILSKEEIKCWLDKFRLTSIEESNLIAVFLKAVYVYNDKMLIILNYKDGEFCVGFDEIKEMLDKKETPDNHNDYQGSPLSNSGDPYETRTHDL